jgi:hypothetical protein
MSSSEPPSITAIPACIHIVRGQRIVLDKDLASLYGVATYRLNEQVKRNKSRFPDDFCFQLTAAEVESLRSHNAISKKTRGGLRYRPFAFTEHGAVMAATILTSEVAIEMSILVVRAFIQLREMLQEHSELKRRLQQIETRIAKGFADHEEELLEIRFLIAQLQESPPLKKRRIGF